MPKRTAEQQRRASRAGRILLASGALTLALGCVNQNTWSPVVDTYNDPNARRLSQDEAQCRQLAIQASGGTTRQTLKDTGIGGLVGAAAGAAIGAAAGNAGMGAAVGAATGGFGGGLYGGGKANSTFKSAFSQCLRERGHTVLSLGAEPASRVRLVQAQGGSTS